MAAYNSAIDNVYNHYLTTYAPKSSVSKYDTHKKSELRGIYNSMLKLNKDAPLYILDNSEESREFVIDLKENARSLRNTIASLGGIESKDMFSKRAAYSTDEEMVSAAFVGEIEEDEDIPSFEIEVKELASGQENLGKALRSDIPVSLTPDAYSFDILINDLNYEFQFAIREDDTNRSVQDRLARLITRAGLGITADVLENGEGQSALRLVSDDIGLRDGKTSIFEISDDRTSKASGAVDYFGLDYISKNATSALFSLNGEDRTASSNHFTIDKKYELTLNNVHRYEGQKAEIGVKTDLESVVENVGNLIDEYNSFIDVANTYKTSHPASSKLLSEMERLTSYYEKDLESFGFSINEKSDIVMDTAKFKSALSNDESYSKLDTIKDFASSVLRKANQISLNPMEYVDKTVVAYKNPGHNFTAPYVSSNYTGMMFNSYC